MLTAGRQDRGRAMIEKAGLYGQNRNCQGSGVQRVRETRKPEGNSDVNEAGMSLKINEMRKCHPHQGFWRRGKVGDFALREAGEANPRGLTHAVAIRYKDSGPSEPKPVILRGIYRLQRKFALFSVNLNAQSSHRSRIRSWESFDAPCYPSVKRDWRKVAGRRSATRGGVGRVRHERAGW